MKKVYLILFILILSSAAYSIENGGLVQYDLFGWTVYNRGASTLSIVNDGKDIIVSGNATAEGAGYAFANKNLGLSGKSKFVLEVAGIDKNSKFDSYKLLKVEINENPLLTVTDEMRNKSDDKYINARNGKAEFDISSYKAVNKVNFVFYNCSMNKVKISCYVK